MGEWPATSHRVRVQRGPSGFLCLSWREWLRLPFTAHIERAQFYRARSASKKGTWPPLLILLRPRVARAQRANSSAHHPSFSPYPVHRSTLLIHHGKHPDAVWLDGIKDCVGKSRHQPATDRSKNDRSGLRKLQDSLCASLDLIEKCRAKPWTFDVVILSGFVQLTAG